MIECVGQGPKLGVAAIVLHDNKILLGQRNKEPMAGSWQLPGGWILAGESPVEAIQRKMSFFPQLRCLGEKFVCYTDNQFENGLHSVSLYFEMPCINAASVDLEGNKDCSDWYWADWYDLPRPLFFPLQLLKLSGYEPPVVKK